MENNGDLADEPHKTFDTILTIDFGSVPPKCFFNATNRVILTDLQFTILSLDYKTIA